MLYGCDIKKEIELNQEICNSFMAQQFLRYSSISCIGASDTDKGLVIYVDDFNSIGDRCNPSGDSLFKILIEVPRKKVKQSKIFNELLKIFHAEHNNMCFSMYIMVTSRNLNMFLRKTCISGGEIYIDDLAKCGKIVLTVPVSIGKRSIYSSYNESLLLKEVGGVACNEFKYINFEKSISSSTNPTGLFNRITATFHNKFSKARNKEGTSNAMSFQESEEDHLSTIGAVGGSISNRKAKLKAKPSKEKLQEKVEDEDVSDTTYLLGKVKLSSTSSSVRKKDI
ncbi:DUF3023 domain-containing protein [Ehrlichia ruminantium]|uniref:DUF3023 domain-containing protein n=1 Tax=Ehrlichia ruminantium TaxID=779 RepID=UPI0015DC1C9E|nr:DUF3023 domain-containing protein [Ehrlichia ruminantium]QLK50522.1 DUF3023 domain-containing protein [Ehrlichia ruminantium]QLK51447.1 DUF3023 domain-containing protein [Ehrlichia ruminantium]QLK53282.1 DUF3023 domain-containing protein [Ehrlichia ruminantium]QLK58782.1 DUF3023 domain-containing protein [Ehrlichia ruminantium]UOD98346.1 DUF3023 domain-containing protein [Ehrlichia ruminantium]